MNDTKIGNRGWKSVGDGSDEGEKEEEEMEMGRRLPLSVPLSVRLYVHSSVCLSLSHLSVCSTTPLHFLVPPPNSPSSLHPSFHLASARGSLFPHIPTFVFHTYFHLHPSERTKKARKNEGKEGQNDGRKDGMKGGRKLGRNEEKSEGRTEGRKNKVKEGRKEQ